MKLTLDFDLTWLWCSSTGTVSGLAFVGASVRTLDSLNKPDFLLSSWNQPIIFVPRVGRESRWMAFYHITCKIHFSVFFNFRVLWRHLYLNLRLICNKRLKYYLSLIHKWIVKNTAVLIKDLIKSLIPNSSHTDALGYRLTKPPIPKQQFLMSWKWDSKINFSHKHDL